MNIYLQIIVYVVLIAGFYVTIITFLDDKIINKKYEELRMGRNENEELWIVTQNIDSIKKEKIKRMLENEDYINIYDIVSKVYIKNKDIDI